jgi:hypothetical protein
MKCLSVILILVLGGCGEDDSTRFTTSTASPDTQGSTTSSSRDDDGLDPIDRTMKALKESPKLDSICTSVKGKPTLIAGIITRREIGIALNASKEELGMIGVDVLILCFSRSQLALEIARQAAMDPRETMVRVKMVSAFGSIINNQDVLQDICPFVDRLYADLVGIALVHLYVAAAELENPAEARFGSSYDRDSWGQRLVNACKRQL